MPKVESPEVKVSQTWEDMDPRHHGRQIRVVEVKDGKAVCVNIATGKKSVISVSRMRVCHRYELVTPTPPLVQQDPAAPTPGAML